MVNILIVDDHSLMRRAVREVVEKEADIKVVAEACNGQEAELQATQTQPDVVLMDVDMPDCSGFDATERVLACSPHSRVIIFTSSHQEQLLFQAIQKELLVTSPKILNQMLLFTRYTVLHVMTSVSQVHLQRRS